MVGNGAIWIYEAFLYTNTAHGACILTTNSSNSSHTDTQTDTGQIIGVEVFLLQQRQLEVIGANVVCGCLPPGSLLFAEEDIEYSCHTRGKKQSGASINKKERPE